MVNLMYIEPASATGADFSFVVAIPESAELYEEAMHHRAKWLRRRITSGEHHECASG